MGKVILGKRENKMQWQIMITPSLKQKIEELKNKTGISMSSIAEQAFERLIAELEAE